MQMGHTNVFSKHGALMLQSPLCLCWALMYVAIFYKHLERYPGALARVCLLFCCPEGQLNSCLASRGSCLGLLGSSLALWGCAPAFKATALLSLRTCCCIQGRSVAPSADVLLRPPQSPLRACFPACPLWP